MNQNQTNRTDIAKLVAAGWNLAYTALWNGEEFSKTEIEIAQISIKHYISNTAEPYKGYLMFCQRVLMARQYLLNNPDKYVPVPTAWLCPCNFNGYVGTERWYTRLQEIRKSQPLFRHQYKALAEALLEMMEEPTSDNFHYWRGWFAERECHATMNVFLSAVANGIYK